MRRWVVLATALAACKSSEPPPKPAPAHAAVQPAVPTAAAAVAPKPGEVRPHHETTVVECPAVVPDDADDDAKLAVLLDTANKQIVASQFGAAWTCGQPR